MQSSDTHSVFGFLIEFPWHWASVQPSSIRNIALCAIDIEIRNVHVFTRSSLLCSAKLSNRSSADHQKFGKNVILWYLCR